MTEYDNATIRRLQAADRLLSYKPNNDKLRTMHKSDSKVRLILGGKRSGKSTFGVVECGWAALGVHPYLSYPPPPLNIRICTVDLSAGVKGIILPMLYDWFPRHSIKKYWADDRIIELINGTLIDLKSYDQDLEKFEGVGRHLVWMDEEPPKQIYQSNYMRTIAANLNMGEMGGKLLVTCTPLHGMTWLYSDLYDNPEAVPPYVEHCHVSIYENPHLSKEAIDAAFKDPAMKDNMEAAAFGRFFSHSGLVYPMFSLDKHRIKAVDKIPDDWLVVLGIDPHDRNPHGVVCCGLTKDNAWIVFDEIVQPGTIDDLVKTMKAKLGKRFPPNLAVADTSANAPQSLSGRSVAEELTQRYGIYLLPAHKDVTAGRLLLSDLLDPGKSVDGTPLIPKLYVTENCHNLIRQFKHYIWDDWATRRREKSDPKESVLKKDDHLLDALRYVCMTNIVYRPPSLTFKPKVPSHVSPVTGYF